MQKRIIVDIDNTLWDFGSVLWEYLREVNSHIPRPTAWLKWDFWVDYVTEKEFSDSIRSIHLNQTHHRFVPYPDAKSFLDSLKKDGYYVLIASHRDEDTLSSTIKWFNTHELAFDAIHIGHDKSVLFDGCHAVIDDSPLLLDKAKHFGIIRSGLMHPWNKESGHPLFSDLNEVYNYIKNGFAARQYF